MQCYTMVFDNITTLNYIHQNYLKLVRNLQIRYTASNI